MKFIRPYKTTSKSARLLRDTLDIPFLKNRNNPIEGMGRHIIINWGGTTPIKDEDNYLTSIYNKPSAVSNVVSKLDFLRYLKTGVEDGEFSRHMKVLPYATDMGRAVSLFEDSDKVYCRKLIKSSKGRGITVATEPGQLEAAPLYTAGVKCKREYRVHMFKEAVVDITAKVRIIDREHPMYREDINDDVRNLDTGYVFARNSVKIPEGVRIKLRDISRQILYYFGLDFGALDIIRSEDGFYYPLELNTAPGITGTTLQEYIRVFNNIRL